MSKYFESEKYQGFDFSTSAVKQTKIMMIKYSIPAVYIIKNNYLYDWYVMLEVLEHVDDLKLLENIDSGQKTNIHSIIPRPSEHIQEIVEERYKDILEIVKIYRYNWDNENDCWSLNAPETEQYILLVNAIKK